MQNGQQERLRGERLETLRSDNMTVLLSSVSGEPAEAIGDLHGRHLVLARGGCAVSEVAKGFRQRRFYDLSDRDKRDVLKLMARVAEQAYRRGVQQGAGLAGNPSFRGDLWEWRYRPSLDLSPWVDSPTTTTSLDRLDVECGEELRGLGLSKNESDDRWWGSLWTDRPWRPVWTGYTPEQRRSIRDGNRPAAVSHKELV